MRALLIAGIGCLACGTRDLRPAHQFTIEIELADTHTVGVRDAVRRVGEIIHQRLHDFGYREAVIQDVGANRLVVILGSLRDPARARRLIERQGVLEFRIVDMEGRFLDALPTIDDALTQLAIVPRPSRPRPSELERLLGIATTSQTEDATPRGASSPSKRPGPLSSHLVDGSIPGEFVVPEEDRPWVDSLLHHPAAQRVVPGELELLWAVESVSVDANSYRRLYALDRRPIITGAYLDDAIATRDMHKQAVLMFQLTKAGGELFERETGRHIGDYMAVVLDGQVHGQPLVIRSPIGRRGQIEWRTSLEEVQDLAVILRVGALPLPVRIVEERRIAPADGR
jgi:preprotein translocase subunit SecD